MIVQFGLNVLVHGSTGTDDVAETLKLISLHIEQGTQDGGHDWDIRNLEFDNMVDKARPVESRHQVCCDPQAERKHNGKLRSESMEYRQADKLADLADRSVNLIQL